MARQLELQREQLSIMEGLFARDLDYPLQSIFLSLDPVSLKSSRLVCTQWSKFIKGRVWGTSKDSAPNSRLRQRLAYHWIHATPTAKSVVLEPDSPDDSFADSGVVYSLSCDDSIVACGLYDYSAKVYDLLNLNLLAVLDSLPPTGLIINDFGGVVVDVGRDVVATVRNMGDVSVWRRSDWSPVFQGRSHGDVIVTQVKVLANLIITGGYDGSLALLSWDGDQVSLMRMIQDEACCPTPRKLNVWNLADNKLVHNLAMQRDSSDNSFEESVVLNYPYAVVLNQKVDVMKVMDLRTGQLIKYLHGYEAHGLHHNKSILVGSVKHDNEQHSVYFCDLRQITNPQQNGPRWKRRKYLEAEDGAGVVRSCVNTSCLVAVLGNKLHVWDFWNCDDFEDTPDIDNMVDLNDNSGEDSDNRVDLNDNSGEDSDNRVDLNDNSGEDGDNMADLNDNSGEDGDNMVDLNDNSGKDGDNMVDMIDN